MYTRRQTGCRWWHTDHASSLVCRNTSRCTLANALVTHHLHLSQQMHRQKLNDALDRHLASVQANGEATRFELRGKPGCKVADQTFICIRALPVNPVQFFFAITSGTLPPRPSQISRTISRTVFTPATTATHIYETAWTLGRGSPRSGAPMAVSCQSVGVEAVYSRTGISRRSVHAWSGKKASSVGHGRDQTQLKDSEAQRCVGRTSSYLPLRTAL